LKSQNEDTNYSTKKSTSLSRAMKLFRYTAPYKGVFFVGFIFLFITGATSLVFPKLMGGMIDASKETSVDEINRIALILLVVFFFQAIASYFRIVTFSYVTEKALAKLRTDVYQRIISMPMAFFSERRVGELNSRIASDVSVIQDTLTTTIAEFLRQMILIVGGIIFLSYISIKLTLFMLASVPVLALVAVVFGRFIKKLSKETQNKVAESNVIVEETFQGIANVKAFTNEKYELKRYTSKVEEIIVFAMKGAKWRGAFASFIIFGLFGAIVGVVWYGTILVQNPENALSIGDLISFILYTVFIGASFGGIAAQYSQIQKAIGATENLLDILDENPEKINFDEITNLKKLEGSISFQNITFSYPTRKELTILSDLSFEIHAGGHIAIVGPSGAGKSTITALLLKFYKPNAGEIYIDGKNADDFELSYLRSQIAIVPQDVLLFGGSIYENIAYGNPLASKEEVIEAAKQANAFEFIASFPDKFETIVGERGVQLSGGQRQRIAIARAVLKNPSILILDEATSALDAESERLVQEALEKLMKGRTSVVIAHRLATIKKADKILVMENGKIIESGTHNELSLIENGLYKKLSNLQFVS
jgi:ABC-type multidrug transport system fused ATPase/permease subunit